MPILRFTGKCTTQDNVGYTTATLAQGESKAFSVAFDDVAEAGKKICVTNIFTAIDGTLKGNAAWGDSMDQIWFWDKQNNVWKFYGYYKARVKDAVPQWRRYDIENNNFDTLIDPETDVFVQGDSFLYVHNESGAMTMTLSGAVKPFTAKKQYVLEQGQSEYIAYPWPVAIKISDFVATKYLPDMAMKGNGAWGDSMDQIWLWDQQANVWKFYGYYKARQKEAVPGWCRYDIEANTFTPVTDEDVIPGDEGILYVHNESGTLTINFEYGK